uniref:Uncharacterized protein n=1 Tax=Anopheles dirus TaxID=7168 RepID=A0A182NGR4_9DIPT
MQFRLVWSREDRTVNQRRGFESNMSDSKCRLCLVAIDPDDCGSSIFDRRLELAMASVFPFEIPFHRNLPMNTCEHCTWIVLDFHTYCKSVQKNQEKLEQERIRDDEIDSDDGLPVHRGVSSIIKEETAFSDDEDQLFRKSPVYAHGPVAVTAGRKSGIGSTTKKRVSKNELLLSESFEEYQITPSSECMEEINVSSSDSTSEADTITDVSEPEQRATKSRRLSTRQAKATVSSNKRVREHNTGSADEFACDHCDKTFHLKQQLSKHQRCHQFKHCP